MRKRIGLGIALMAASQLAMAGQIIDWARVLSVSPQVQHINQPHQECRTDYVRERVYEPAHSTTGAIVGGVAGGLLGSTIGKGSGRIVAAAVGAGLGAVVGDRVGSQNSYGRERIVNRPVQQCMTVDQWQTVTTGYVVNYEYQGRQYSTVMDRHPGAFMEVAVQVNPQSYVLAQPVPAAYRPAIIKGRGPKHSRHYW